MLLPWHCAYNTPTVQPYEIIPRAAAMLLQLPEPALPPAPAASSSTRLHAPGTPRRTASEPVSVTLLLRGCPQADLEVISAGAARHASDLRHALASNKKLLKWKVTTAPRIEALKTKVDM